MKTTSLLLLVLMGSCWLSPVYAQRIVSPDSYFNEGAYRYTENKTDQALEHVEQGLKQYPNNAKLIKLKELLEKQQQQEQQQQQQNQEEQENDQNQDKNDKNQQKDDQKDQKEDKKDQKDKKDDQKDKNGEKNDKEQQEQQQPQKAEQMTPEEAEMLLDAMRNDEKAQRDAMRMIMGAPEPPQNGKDW